MNDNNMAFTASLNHMKRYNSNRFDTIHWCKMIKQLICLKGNIFLRMVFPYNSYLIKDEKKCCNGYHR